MNILVSILVFVSSLPSYYAFCIRNSQLNNNRPTKYHRTLPYESSLRTTQFASSSSLSSSQPQSTTSDIDNDDESTSNSTTGDDDETIPFFAKLPEAAFMTTPAPPTTPPTTTTKASVTYRLPLGTIFDSRDYIFTAATNVRGYEWGQPQVDELVDDLMYASSTSSTSNNDYELNQIILVPMDWDTVVYGLGARYDVYDGQQRLVTLCLLLAAIRDSFQQEIEQQQQQEHHDATPTTNSNSEKKNHNAIVAEISNMLHPVKVRKKNVVRIELRERDNTRLHQILVNQQQQQEALPFTVTDERIFNNYNRIKQRIIDELSIQERIQLLDYIIERVHLLVCIPENNRIARNIVMSNGKGMDLEPIDDFKGLVCFRYTQAEEEQIVTFDRWAELASPPTFDNSNNNEVGNGGVAVSVGRDIVASACRLRAAAALKTQIRKNNELSILEQWLREDLTKHKYEGKDFYKKEVEPSSILLDRFRNNEFDTFHFLIDKNASTTRLGKTVKARLRFISQLASNVGSTKEIEIIVLELLLRANATPGFQPLYLKELDDYLCAVELLTLWMALSKPSTMKRHLKCFELLDLIHKRDRKSVTEVTITSEEEKTKLRDTIFWTQFGATLTGKKIAAAILERLNAHAIILGSNPDILPENYVTHWQVECILPKKSKLKYWQDQWPDEEKRESWVNLLGNLALMSTSKVTTKESDKTFNTKKERYIKEPWPLTNGLSRHADWNQITMEEQEADIESFMKMVWGF